MSRHPQHFQCFTGRHVGNFHFYDIQTPPPPETLAVFCRSFLSPSPHLARPLSSTLCPLHPVEAGVVYRTFIQPGLNDAHTMVAAALAMTGSVLRAVPQCARHSRAGGNLRR
jgi:hypothetical protein